MRGLRRPCDRSRSNRSRYDIVENGRASCRRRRGDLVRGNRNEVGEGKKSFRVCDRSNLVLRNLEIILRCGLVKMGSESVRKRRRIKVD